MEETYTITQLAQEFNITSRTIRYYEELGLISPARSENGRRVFTKKEKTLLFLIFRGKKYGFQLEEIKDMLHLFDHDPSGRKQLERTIEYGEKKIMEVTDRIVELTEMRDEMVRVTGEFRVKLTELEGEKE
ncbi:MerR family transcriptional regulator [Pontibacillus yanchengensis]|uniref:MerR family transcriptional regulator n=2 Tax=Pontibacillus yanchengensis TaxID=462910 RepID=A0ACC7VGH2_9BACI|nr:MerR family transcriptional regulator [Pontibacillus yanchengensis]MYL34021.1 MerR family transcriptional regulator [Pontibacillus yanchengensis]MYL54071.1 MerR family transcriptional regulator [Pontibacillus yanchengensis]